MSDTRRAGDALMQRLIGCLPAATFEMETLCRLAGIEVSARVPTAAVEVALRPRLLLNPAFTDRYCQRDEHLFLLVMHELWHILLAHTRLYPRVTPAHNIAFDAIINAGLTRQFPQPQYRGFFEAVNPPDQFPHLLLRPPVGFPREPYYPPDVGPEGTLDILRRLYPTGPFRWVPPLYEEILALLRRWADENDGAWLFGDGAPVLLGDHTDGDKRALADSTFRSIVQRVVQKWPPAPLPLGRGDGGGGSHWFTSAETADEAARRAFANTLRQTLIIRPGAEKRRTRTLITGVSGTGVLPNARDRHAPARRQLGVPALLWSQTGEVKARVPETPAKTHVYLDVSGSMGRLLPRLIGLLLPYVARGAADVYQFSTRVEPLPYKQLRDGQLNTTFGTNINCVLEHLLAFKPPVRRALIVTDGAVGRADVGYAHAVGERGLRLYVVLPAESAFTQELERLAVGITILPPAG